jgi:hypothetical protein
MAIEGSVPTNGVIVPHLVVSDAGAAAEFYERAFGATILYRSPSPSGHGEHIHLRVWSALIQVSTEEPEYRRSKLQGSFLASPETLQATTPSTPGSPAVAGSYTFRKELGGHVLARHSTSSSCKAPTDFDCQHGDLLYVYVEEPGQRLKAIYFDNEGHVIHYNISTPTSSSVEFLSDSSMPGPQFRLSYDLKNEVMTGKFQVHMPGGGEWKSYLEWSGKKIR